MVREPKRGKRGRGRGRKETSERAPFAGERRFSKFRGLSVSVSFVPLPHPPLSFFGSRPIFRAGKTPKIPFLGLSLLPNPTETLATQAIKTLTRRAQLVCDIPNSLRDENKYLERVFQKNNYNARLLNETFTNLPKLTKRIETLHLLLQ